MKAVFNRNSNSIRVEFSTTRGSRKIDEIKVLKNNDSDYYSINGERIVSDIYGKLVISHYTNGELNGEQIEYYDDAVRRRIKRISNWSNNKKNGNEELFYESGITKAIRSWINGLANDKWFEYYDKKEDKITYKKSVQSYKNGLKHGVYQQWYENKDEKTDKIWYLNGVKVSAPLYEEYNNKDPY